jgi:ABC-2 type transport system permease protein
MKKYWTVALLGWQDSLVYRFNALVWALYAVLPSVTFMLVWLATYQSNRAATIGGFNLSQMLTYYICVTTLSVVITPNPEWDIAQAIRDGKITQFIVRPIGYFGYRVAQETSYQIIKSAMTLPCVALLVYFFRAYIQLPKFDFAHWGLFLFSALLSYALLTHIKFLMGISAFWISEPGGFLEIWNVLMGVFGGRLLPLALLPAWIGVANGFLPFSSLYAFPVELLLKDLSTPEILAGFARQIAWLGAMVVLVRVAWQRGLLAYEGYGG